jgi:hypothetical protein
LRDISNLNHLMAERNDQQKNITKEKEPVFYDCDQTDTFRLGHANQ